MKDIRATPKEIRKFGILFTVLSVGAMGFSLYKGGGGWMWLAFAALFFLLTGLFLQTILKPIYVGWMTFAHVLGWINTRFILGLVFYAIFSPVGLFLRLIRKDILSVRIDKQASSYWRKRRQGDLDKKRYEQLF